MRKILRASAIAVALLASRNVSAQEAEEDAAAPGEEEAKPEEPARAFAKQGALLLSADEALPLVSLGQSAPLGRATSVRIGNASGVQAPSPVHPFSFDIAVIDRLTLGLTPLVEHTVARSSPVADTREISLVGGNARAGYVVPLGKRAVLWPRLGLSFLYSKGSAYEASENTTEVTGDVRLGWIPARTWMLTLGPSLGIPVVSKEGGGGGSDGAFVLPSGVMRIAVSAGVTVKLDASKETAPDDEASRAPRFLLGVERVAPLVRLRLNDNGDAALDAGLTDATNATTLRPGIGFDVVAFRKLTFGTAASVGFIHTDRTASRAPRDLFELTLAPRMGAFFSLSDHFALWPRAGVGWHFAPDASGPKVREHQLTLDLDAFAVIRPAPGFGITFGPSLSTLLADSGVPADAVPTTAPGTPFMPVVLPSAWRATAALNAGILLLL